MRLQTESAGMLGSPLHRDSTDVEQESLSLFFLLLLHAAPRDSRMTARLPPLLVEPNPDRDPEKSGETQGVEAGCPVDVRADEGSQHLTDGTESDEVAECTRSTFTVYVEMNE